MFDEANRWLALPQQDDGSSWKLSQHFRVYMPQANYAEFQQLVDRFSATQESESTWPVWPRFLVGSYLSRRGDSAGTIRLLEPLFEDGLPSYNGTGGGSEIIDRAHHLALAYLNTGEQGKAELLLERVLERQFRLRQGRTKLIGVELAREAVTYSLQGRSELATSRMLDAIAAGWRAYYMAETNPCFDELFRQPGVQTALAYVRDDLNLQRERVRSADQLNPRMLPEVPDTGT